MSDLPTIIGAPPDDKPISAATAKECQEWLNLNYRIMLMRIAVSVGKFMEGIPPSVPGDMRYTESQRRAVLDLISRRLPQLLAHQISTVQDLLEHGGYESAMYDPEREARKLEYVMDRRPS